MDSAQGQDSDLAPFFGDFSQIEKLSEIKPPLILHKDKSTLQFWTGLFLEWSA